MSQYTQLNGDLPFGLADIQYARHLTSSLKLDLDAIINKGEKYTMSREKLISDKVALFNDLLEKWKTIGGMAEILKKFSGRYPQETYETAMNYGEAARLQTKKESLTPEQEQVPETFLPYIPGKAFRSPPQAQKNIFSEPSPETLAKLNAPVATFVTAEQAREIRDTGSVKTGLQSKTPGLLVSDETVIEEKKGIPAMAMVAAAAALYFLNK